MTLEEKLEKLRKAVVANTSCLSCYLAGRIDDLQGHQNSELDTKTILVTAKEILVRTDILKKELVGMSFIEGDKENG